MPLFTYTITRGAEVRTAQLRKSNPQGWLLEAVSATFPEVASRRGAAIIRLRLDPGDGPRRTWRAKLVDQPADLAIHVEEIKS